ncbi:MAG: 4Fe-4S binding protein [Planctomycetes bacterium]|nr:4Fe-4S binding protein [Planctomycetota bacterium]
MRRPLLLPILFAALGGFMLASQALLFREYLVSFEGNELGVAFFFGSWLLWIGAGALLWTLLPRRLTGERLFLPLLALLPLAVLLQMVLLISLRKVAGVEPFELFAFDALFLSTLAANAPAGLLFGFLFPAGSVFAAAGGNAAAAAPGLLSARLYAFESLGSAAGGVLVTALLWREWPAPLLIALGAAALCCAVLAAAIAERRFAAAALALVLLACCAAALYTPFGARLEAWLARLRWEVTLPAAELLETRESPYQQLSTAALPGQSMLLSNGAVVASTADEPDHQAAAALLLAQGAHARAALVIGLAPEGLVPHLLHYPLSRLDLVLFDPAAHQLAAARLGDEVRRALADPRVTVHFGDARDVLARRAATATGERYDLVFLDLPDPGTAHLNRFYTVEFFRTLRDLASDRAVLALRIRAGENYAGTEVVNYGRSVYQTLRAVFPEVAVAPGERAWLFASPAPEVVTSDAALLEKRFRALSPRDESVPPEIFASLLPPERAAAAQALFAETAGLDPESLVNRDERPVTLFLNLLVLGAESGGRLARVLKALRAAGPAAFLIPLLVFLALRLAYRATTRVAARAGGTNGALLLAAAGGVSMCLDILLLVSFQNRFGHLFLSVGLLSALFMLGLCAGGLLGVRLFRRAEGFAFWPAHAALFPAVALCLALPLLVDLLAKAPSDLAHTAYLALFLVAGGACGVAFPAAGYYVERAAKGTGRVAGLLETADHWGGAAGAAVAGVLALPLLGLAWTCVLLALALCAVWALFVAEQAGGALRARRLLEWAERARQRNAGARLRAPAYLLYGAVLAFVLVSNLVHAELSAPRVRLDLQWIKNRCHALRVEEREEPFIHYLTFDEGAAGFREVLAASRAIVPDIEGYGGPINLLVEAGREGAIQSVTLFESNETPAYIHGVGGWLARFSDWPLSRPIALGESGIDAMTGATVSSRAMSEILEEARQAIAAAEFDLPATGGERPGIAARFDLRSLYVLAALLLAVPLFLRGGARLRDVFLLANLGLAGFLFNLQFSLTHVARVLGGSLPALSAFDWFLLVAGVLALAVGFGPLYCGYLCPFGAVQELLGRLGLARATGSATEARARVVKHLVLAAALVLAACVRSEEVLAFDPLAAAFSFDYGTEMALLLGLIALFSLLHLRFFCRYLCPAGAFLALFNFLGPLARWARPKSYGRCDLGTKDRWDSGCLQCNRCLWRKEAVEGTAGRARRAVFGRRDLVLAGGIAAALLLGGLIARSESTGAPSAAAAALGQPRDVDLDLIRRRIQEQRLSGREALFYRRLGESEEARPPEGAERSPLR